MKVYLNALPALDLEGVIYLKESFGLIFIKKPRPQSSSEISAPLSADSQYLWVHLKSLKKRKFATLQAGSTPPV